MLTRDDGFGGQSLVDGLQKLLFLSWGISRLRYIVVDLRWRA